MRNASQNRPQHAARATKARKLADVAVAAASTPAALAIVLAGLRVCADNVWEDLRCSARVNPPSRPEDRHLGVSHETRAAVIAEVERHVAIVEEMARLLAEKTRYQAATRALIASREEGLVARDWFDARSFGGAP